LQSDTQFDCVLFAHFLIAFHLWNEIMANWIII
jgi:hypothetical protein